MKKLYLTILPLMILGGCLESATPEEMFNYWKQEDIHMIIQSKDDVHKRDITLYGKDLYTGRDTSFENSSGYLLIVHDSLKIGDTIIKPKGKYNMLIKRKGKQVLLPYQYGRYISYGDSIKKNASMY